MWLGLFKEKPKILAVSPYAAIEGGEITLRCKGVNPKEWPRLRVVIDSQPARPSIITDTMVRVYVPKELKQGGVRLFVDDVASNEVCIKIGQSIFSDVTIPLTPVIDERGFLYCFGHAAMQGNRQIIKLNPDGQVVIICAAVKSPVSLCVAQNGELFITTAENCGSIIRLTNAGSCELVATGIGSPSGIVVTPTHDLLVGDRQGAVFKISQGKVSKLATIPTTLEDPRLVLAPNGELFITTPEVSETRPILAVDQSGRIREVIDVFSKPTDLAFDPQGLLHVVAHYHGVEGVYRVTDNDDVRLIVAGRNLRGLTFTTTGELLVAGYRDVYRLVLGATR